MVAQQPFRTDEQGLVIAQLGLITRKQALGCGHTASSIRAKVGRGEWVRVSQGVYRAALHPVSKEQRILSLCLRSAGKAWASHRTAAWLHGFGREPDKEIEITSSVQLAAGAGCRIHRTSMIAPCDITTVRKVPTTAAERTLLDFAATATPHELELAVDEALVTKKTSLDKIEWRLRRTGGRGRPGSAALARCLADRQRVGQIDSHLERQFLDFLRAAEVPTPRLQFPIKIGERTFRADFAYPEHKLIIEVMGYRWHGGRDRWERDLSRSSDLGAAGWRILYVTKAQMVKARRDTMNRVRQALGYRPLFVL
jgi:very-short-patch-repair endonuclease